MKRIHSIDITRGLVMIIMALDHVRDLLHVHAVTQSPTNLATTTPLLFFTRWITYLCAPVFVFLAGTSAYLSFRNKGNVSQSRVFLLKRGIWLVLLEFTLVNLGLFFDLGFHTLIFEVIATIGFGFIALSLMLKLSNKTIGLIGLIIVFCHNLFPLIPFEPDSTAKAIISPFFSLGVFKVFSSHIFTMAYPPVPWLGIMLLGFASGKIFESPEDKRKRIFLRIGAGALLLFVLLRYINSYGDPAIWSTQKTTIFTILSFMNITKYPPSLLFCLVTLGIMFLILAIADQANNRITRIAQVYGKVPLFYFIIHFYIIHFLLLIVLFLQGFHWADLNFASGTFGRPNGVQSGVPLWGVYLIWVSLVMALYKPCVWFGKYKARHKNGWLSYI
jgi:uncharacterized membrane protein